MFFFALVFEWLSVFPPVFSFRFGSAAGFGGPGVESGVFDGASLAVVVFEESPFDADDFVGFFGQVQVRAPAGRVHDGCEVVDRVRLNSQV